VEYAEKHERSKQPLRMTILSRGLNTTGGICGKTRKIETAAQDDDFVLRLEVQPSPFDKVRADSAFEVAKGLRALPRRHEACQGAEILTAGINNFYKGCAEEPGNGDGNLSDVKTRSRT
jgi:translation initiation factor IF-1